MTFSFPAKAVRTLHRAMTLVEVMIAFAVFAIAIVGSLSAIIFSLNNVDSARTETQVTQILVNEMEAMRMRPFELADPTKDREVKPGLFLLTLRHLALPNAGVAAPAQENQAERKNIPFADLPSEVRNAVNKYREDAESEIDAEPAHLCWSAFHPFAVYGVASATPGTPVARVGKEVLSDAKVQIRNAAGYTCERYVAELPASVKSANAPSVLVVLRVSWTNARGTHSRTLSTIILSNGLNNQFFRLNPIPLT